jgi:hypothetical protein
MRQNTSYRVVRRGLGALAAAALVAGATLFGASPAHARNEFKNGFEDQLGRIAAVGAVNFGLSVLSGGYYPVAPAVVPVPVAPVVYAPPVYYRPVYHPVHPAYYGPRHVVVKHKHVKHYRHGKHRGHGHRW